MFVTTLIQYSGLTLIQYSGADLSKKLLINEKAL